MADPSFASQKALFAALNGNVTYGTGSPALVVPVYDNVPQGSTYPYIVIDNQYTDSDDPLASRRDLRFFYLNVWSTYAGQKEVLEIIAQIDALLAYKRFPMETGRMVRCEVIRKRTIRDADNVTYQGQVTLRVITEH